MYTAYKKGRAPVDPSDGWYEGELGFFAGYVIPLAEKLKTCKVFGVECDQLLDYAKQNQQEWKNKGKDLVEMWKKEQQYL